MHIIGVTGMFGAGKGTVVSYLVQRKGFSHYSMSGFITEEVVRRGLPVHRDSMIVVANDLRATFGITHIVDSLYACAIASEHDAIIESLRALGEVRRVKELGGTIIGVDADRWLRYCRIRARKSEKDDVTYEQFVAQESLESQGDDSFKQNLLGALQEADVVLNNDGTVESLYQQIDTLLGR